MFTSKDKKAILGNDDRLETLAKLHRVLSRDMLRSLQTIYSVCVLLGLPLNFVEVTQQAIC